MVLPNLRSIVSIALILGNSYVSAAIVDNDKFTTDTISGLDWMDVTETSGLSFDEVSVQLGIGGAYEGWRYATDIEFNTLVGNYTSKIITEFGFVNQEPNLIDGLVILLGSTLDTFYVKNYGKTFDAYYGFTEGEGVDRTFGIINDTKDNSVQWLAIILDNDGILVEADYTMAHTGLLVDYNGLNSIQDIGSYLVRDTFLTVPTPTVAILMVPGLLVMFGISRRKD
jgi:hypothetical protein